MDHISHVSGVLVQAILQQIACPWALFGSGLLASV